MTACEYRKVDSSMIQNVRFAFILANQAKKMICTEQGDRVRFIIDFIFGILTLLALFLLLNYRFFNNAVMMLGELSEFWKLTLYLLFGIVLWFILRFLKVLAYLLVLQLHVIHIEDLK